MTKDPEPNRDETRPGAPDGPNLAVKLAVVGFLAVFCLVAVGSVEAWPFTAWRLFSERRGPVSTAPRPYAVTSTGDEHPINVNVLPVAYRQANRLLIQFPRFTEDERRGVCDGLAEGLRGSGQDFSFIRIYRVTRRSHIEHGRPVAKTTRDLTYTCPTPAPT